MFIIENQYILILACLGFSGLLSGLEIAYVSRDKLNFEIKSNSNSFFGNIYNILNKNSSELIASLQIGINLSLVVYGIIMAQTVEPYLIQNLPTVINNDLSVLLVQTLISTLIVLITAEYIPKSVFLINPDKLLTTFSIPLIVIYFVLNPLVKFILIISRFLIKIIPFTELGVPNLGKLISN